MSEYIIGIDFDDVLFDFNTAMLRYHNDTYGTDVQWDDIYTYYLEYVYGCELEEIKQRIHDYVRSEQHQRTPPVEGAIDSVAKLAQQYDVHVITSRPPRLEAQTTRWLSENIPELAGRVHFTSDFEPEARTPKSEVCSELGIDMFVDDAPHYIDDIAPVVDQVFLFDRPWNRAKTDLPANARRVHSWDEIRQVLDE